MKIETLSLIASTRCNLRCTYCFLCKTESSSITDDKIREAVTDGSYLYNCNRVITTLGATCGDITKLDFWGGEPTLNLSLWIEKIPDWAKYYKNIEIRKAKVRRYRNAMKIANNPENVKRGLAIMKSIVNDPTSAVSKIIRENPGVLKEIQKEDVA